MPCSAPSVRVHMHRELWMWPAGIRTVRRGARGSSAKARRQVLDQVYRDAIIRATERSSSRGSRSDAVFIARRFYPNLRRNFAQNGLEHSPWKIVLQDRAIYSRLTFIARPGDDLQSLHGSRQDKLYPTRQLADLIEVEL